MAKKWLQNAVNPAHKGYCTPMTKATCTPRRKAFAMRAKHGGFSKGGVVPSDYYNAAIGHPRRGA
jgi:hypothetical protein